MPSPGKAHIKARAGVTCFALRVQKSIFLPASPNKVLAATLASPSGPGLGLVVEVSWACRVGVSLVLGRQSLSQVCVKCVAGIPAGGPELLAQVLEGNSGEGPREGRRGWGGGG